MQYKQQSVSNHCQKPQHRNTGFVRCSQHQIPKANLVSVGRCRASSQIQNVLANVIAKVTYIRFLRAGLFKTGLKISVRVVIILSGLTCFGWCSVFIKYLLIKPCGLSKEVFYPIFPEILTPIFGKTTDNHASQKTEAKWVINFSGCVKFLSELRQIARSLMPTH